MLKKFEIKIATTSLNLWIIQFVWYSFLCWLGWRKCPQICSVIFLQVSIQLDYLNCRKVILVSVS